MKYNHNNRKAYMNWTMTTTKNMVLYLIMIILKHPNKRKSKEDM